MFSMEGLYNPIMKLSATPSVKFGSFAALEARLVPKLMKGAAAGAQAVYDESQIRVPVAGGTLKTSGSTSVEWKGTKVTGYVMYSAGHAAFVEFGTGIVGRGTYPFDLPTSGVPITGEWVYDYKQQDWRGMVAQPYLRPALDICKQQILDAFQEALSI